MRFSTRSRRGGRAGALYSLALFILLASLDNAAGALYPALTKPMAADLGVSEAWMGGLTALLILAIALAAVGWGYLGDRSNRRPLMFWGTLLWAGALLMAGRSATAAELALWTIVLGVGLGSIASVGFSIVSDLISPRRRGLAMSFWGLSQGAGGFVGLVAGGLLGAGNWRTPFLWTAAAAIITGTAYLVTTPDILRGGSEPEIARALKAGAVYDYRIEFADLPKLLAVRTNIWLILQGLTAQIAYGSLIWVPLLYQGKVLAEGYDLPTAVAVGAVFGGVFQLGAVTSIAAGHLGDRMQARRPEARALVAMVGILGAIPFFIAFFNLPLTGLDIPVGQGTAAVAWAALGSVFTNPYAAAAFGLSFLALMFTSADSPNWFALISEVNPPEHRGTLYGLGNLSNGISRAAGAWLTALAAAALQSRLGPLTGYAVGLTVFQIFFIPTGFCYWRAAKTCPRDMRTLRATLAQRARDSLAPPPPPDPPPAEPA